MSKKAGTLEEYLQLRKELDSLTRRLDRAQGALDQTLELLNKDFGVTTVKEAEEEQHAGLEETRELAAQLEQGVKEFKKKWRRLL